MAKNNRSRGSNSSKDNSKVMDFEEATSGVKRGRGSGNEDSSLELVKKPNKIMVKSRVETEEVKDNIRLERTRTAISSSVSNFPENEFSVRLVTIKKQLRNRYNRWSLPPFIAFIEGKNEIQDNDKLNIGNMHPMELTDLICRKFDDKDIIKFKRLGRNSIVVSFKNFMAANKFVEESKNLPEGWLSYIPNYKIYRTAVVRGVNPGFSTEKIKEIISWPGEEIKIDSIERLKFRDRNSGALMNSSSIKIILETNLLPEYLYIAKWKMKVVPFINNVRRCFKCSRWGHSSRFCRGKTTCAKCSANHITEDCKNENLKCSNCSGDHHSFDTSCYVYERNKIINTIMAYANISRFHAIKLMKVRNILDINQVENSFRSLAYKAWNIRDIDSISIRSMAPSHISSLKSFRRGKSHKIKSKLVETNKKVIVPVGSSSRFQSCIESSDGERASVGMSHVSRTSRTSKVRDKSISLEESLKAGMILEDILRIIQQDKPPEEKLNEFGEYWLNLNVVNS